MRLARRAPFVALAMLVLCAAVSAQTLRQENDPRNISPSVGTGGNPGGPTGLFTIYDGQTLRRGEFTFSIAYSNFDRDPGNVDITEIPVSFQVGINDHLEVFFNTDAYRGIKVNSPANLSSFYLPNSQLTFGGGTPPAIVMGPSGPNVGSLARLALFRPAGSQPFVQFPFVGGSAGTFGLGPGPVGGIFGFPGFNAQLGPPTSNGGGRWGPADNFPGIGSPVGGILPGVVLATQVLPPTGLSPGTTVPASYTVAPAYLPDAPFINRRYGQTAFSTFTVGAKVVFTGPRNPLSFGVVGLYRFYADKADDFSGFNQLQRGASSGANLGDFGAILFLSGRLSRSVNISVNGGYILNSNPKGQFPGGEFTLLDRPDELLTGLGFDFPINKHFQPMFELRSTQYVGGRTPNAFGNNPIDALGGVKIYPRRWFGFGAAYRYHLNQQDLSQFEGRDFNTPVVQLTGIVSPGQGVITVAPTTVPATAGAFPRGFQPSDDANGFIFQFFAGRRNERAPEFLPNQAPTVTLTASSATVTQPCPPGTSSAACPEGGTQSVTLAANATDPDGDTLLYTYSTTGGRITGEGPNATWDLSGVTPGTYTSTVEVDDGCGCVSFSSTTVTVAACTNCVAPCPTVTVECPTGAIQPGSPATVTVNVSGGAPGLTPTYNWSVSDGTISGGQGTASITIDTTGQAGKNITATVEIGGLPPECQRTASCSFSVVPPPPECSKFDEYGNIVFNDEKARLDNYAIQLQNDPTATGYIIAYADRTGPEGQAAARAQRAKDYLVNTRGIDASRITTIDGGCRETLTVELFVCAQGATAPSATGTVPCEPRPARAPRRRSGRRR
jgi:hypothetical protein